MTPPDADPWEPIRQKIASHTVPFTQETHAAIAAGTYRIPRHAIPTNEELADAVENSMGAPLPYEMALLIASRLRWAPTPGLQGRPRAKTALPEDAQHVCATYAMVMRAYDWRFDAMIIGVGGERRTARAEAIKVAAEHCRKEESTVRNMLKNHWKAFCCTFPDFPGLEPPTG
jgi:hypothetical protein